MSELFSVEAEEAVLGDILINPQMWGELNLAAADFYFERHRMIWSAAGQVQRDGQLLDYVTLLEQLRRSATLAEIGGPAFLVKLLNSTPTSFNAVSHADVVRDLSRRRQIVTIAQDLVHAAQDSGSNVLYAQSSALDELGKTAKTTGGAVPIAEWAVETYGTIAERAESGAPELLPTGFADLDAMIGGLDPDEGTLFLLGGRPGAGKTILFSNIAENLQADAPGALYSLEMKRKRMMMRSMSAATGISAWKMRRGKVGESELDQLAGELDRYADMRLFVSDGSSWTTSSLRADLIRLKHERGIRWYGVDYLGLLTDDLGKGVKEHERLAHLSRRLLQINRDLGLASIIIHTATKENFGNRSSGGSFAGSAAVQYDMDVGAVLKTPEDFVPNGREEMEPRILSFVKNRDGERANGDIDLLKHARLPKFATPATQHQVIRLNGHPERS